MYVRVPPVCSTTDCKNRYFWTFCKNRYCGRDCKTRYKMDCLQNPVSTPRPIYEAGSDNNIPEFVLRSILNLWKIRTYSAFCVNCVQYGRYRVGNRQENRPEPREIVFNWVVLKHGAECKNNYNNLPWANPKKSTVLVRYLERTLFDIPGLCKCGW